MPVGRADDPRRRAAVLGEERRDLDAEARRDHLERGQRGNGLAVLDLGEVARREPAVCREQLEREPLPPSEPLESLPQMPEVVVDHGSSQCKRIFPLG